MSIQKTCPYCGGRGYITHIEALPDCGRAWTKRCIACEGTGLILYKETNGDKVRRMSDKELAHWVFYEARRIGDYYTDHVLGLEDWLGKEAE